MSIFCRHFGLVSTITAQLGMWCRARATSVKNWTPPADAVKALSSVFSQAPGLMDVNVEELSKLNLWRPLAGAAASVTIQRPSSVNVQISLPHCHCFKSKTRHSPPSLSLCAECWEVSVPNVVWADHCWVGRGNLLHEPEGCSSPCPLSITLYIAKPLVLGNLFCVSRGPSVLEPEGLWFSHRLQQQCQSLPSLEYDKMFSF